MGGLTTWGSTREAAYICMSEPEATAEKLKALQDQAPDDAWWILVRL